MSRQVNHVTKYIEICVYIFIYDIFIYYTFVFVSINDCFPSIPVQNSVIPRPFAPCGTWGEETVGRSAGADGLGASKQRGLAGTAGVWALRIGDDGMRTEIFCSKKVLKDTDAHNDVLFFMSTSLDKGMVWASCLVTTLLSSNGVTLVPLVSQPPLSFRFHQAELEGLKSEVEDKKEQLQKYGFSDSSSMLFFCVGRFQDRWLYRCDVIAAMKCNESQVMPIEMWRNGQCLIDGLHQD